MSIPDNRLAELELNAKAAKEYKASHVHLLTDTVLELVAALREARTQLLIAQESGNAEAGEHEQARADLAALRTAVTELADKWTNRVDEAYDYGMKLRTVLEADE